MIHIKKSYSNKKLVLSFCIAGAVFYSLYWDPLFNTEKLRERQIHFKQDIKKDEIQPEGLTLRTSPHVRRFKKESQAADTSDLTNDPTV